jgi:hypothetical protein
MAWAAENCSASGPRGCDNVGGSVCWDGFRLAVPTIMRGGTRGRRVRRKAEGVGVVVGFDVGERWQRKGRGDGGFLLARWDGRLSLLLVRRAGDGWPEALANERAGPSGRRRARSMEKAKLLQEAKKRDAEEEKTSV